MDLSVNKSIKAFCESNSQLVFQKSFTTSTGWQWNCTAFSTSSETQIKKHISKNIESSNEESDETCRSHFSDNDDDSISYEESKSSDNERDDEDSNGSSFESSDEDTKAEFEPVDASTARMKSVRGKWLCEAIDYLKSIQQFWPMALRCWYHWLTRLCSRFEQWNRKLYRVRIWW